MTLPVPLSVRIVTTKSDRHVETELHDLSFRSVCPGGFASARMSLNRPLHLDPDDLAYFGQVKVYDKRNGSVVWEGRIEDLGRGAGDFGEIREIAAVGGSAHARDRTIPLVYVDRTTTKEWVADSDAALYFDVTEATSNDVPVVLIRAPEGTTVTQFARGSAVYRRLVDCSQRIARIWFDYGFGVSTSNNTLQMKISVGVGGAETTAESIDWATGFSFGSLLARITNDWSSGTAYDTVYMTYYRNGASAAAANSSWQVVIPVIIPVRMDASGSNLLTAASYPDNYVRAHEVVNDLLGRVLTDFDGPNASVATNSYDIEQLAFPDGATPADMLDALMAFHPDHYWAAWERSSSDLYRFEWRAWPTTIRYEADVVDGFDAPGSVANLFNAVAVRYIGAQGQVRHRRRTSTVALLDDVGLTRESYLDLDVNAGSENNATQTGDEFLDDHSVITNTGKLTIARPIIDRDNGMTIMPWQIRPGELIRVRGVQPTLDALNTTTRNSVTVFKITAVDYDTTTAAATLELDSQPIDTAHLLARSQPGKTIAKKRR